MSASV